MTDETVPNDQQLQVDTPSAGKRRLPLKFLRDLFLVVIGALLGAYFPVLIAKLQSRNQADVAEVKAFAASLANVTHKFDIYIVEQDNTALVAFSNDADQFGLDYSEDKIENLPLLDANLKFDLANLRYNAHTIGRFYVKNPHNLDSNSPCPCNAYQYLNQKYIDGVNSRLQTALKSF